MLKIFASIFWVAGMGVIFYIASQNGSVGPVRLSGPEWLHSHY